MQIVPGWYRVTRDVPKGRLRVAHTNGVAAVNYDPVSGAVTVEAAVRASQLVRLLAYLEWVAACEGTDVILT